MDLPSSAPIVGAAMNDDILLVDDAPATIGVTSTSGLTSVSSANRTSAGATSGFKRARAPKYASSAAQICVTAR
jgi:hypothetical protein